MSWNLAELTYAQVKQRPYEVAVLPLGATEPHNLHLPYGTDIFEGTVIGQQICTAATACGARVVLLPTIPFGTETNLRQFPLAINLNPSTLSLVIQDIVASLDQSGIRKVVLLNSHGGNDLKPVLRELYGRVRSQVFLCNWYQMIGDQYDQIFTHRDDHAGEMETSFALAYFPHLVGRSIDGQLNADRGEKAPFRLQALREGWVTVTRPWHLLTTNSGAGYPHEATAEKGKQLMQLIVDRLSEFLVELSEATVDEPFPF